MKPRSSQYVTTREEPVAAPPFRRLRGYAFDPSLSQQVDTALVNEVVFKVPWEESAERLRTTDSETETFEGGEADEGLSKGPVGEYLEVIDYDPASRCFYAPINLDSPLVLAQDGLAPTEGNPQFHQQMVYAVAMTTIRNFERALGRYAFWAPHIARSDEPNGRSGVRSDFVRRLRIYPHALREANAYYSPTKKALLFGYFVAPPSTGADGHFPGGTVFTCLSHDVIAHETTHALLDGLHRRYTEPTNPDSLAFHEAIADIVALFQHFSFPEVLRHQISRTRGDLASENELGKLARQFGRGVGLHGALRDAIGEVDPVTKQWRPRQPDPEDYQRKEEPHERGAILVAAIFDAFLAIYRARVADLYRIATSGTGVLPQGAIHPDLVNRLAEEAARSAQHVLNMCVRALDYTPPVDITFGDYLRAIITADSDLVPDDDLGYRVAFIEAFRRRGIYPRDVRTLSIDSLRWPVVRSTTYARKDMKFAEELREYMSELKNLGTSRRAYYGASRDLAAKLQRWIHSRDSAWGVYLEEATSQALRFQGSLPGLEAKDGVAVFEIHSVRPAQRVGPDGDTLNHAVVSITQKRRNAVSESVHFRGGATLIFNLDTGRLQYAIVKGIADDARLRRQQEFVTGIRDGSLRATYFGGMRDAQEPFAMLHRAAEQAV
ncbi:MAG: hypothetical protein HY899_02965 [Deltaproteobacteria bacterium]|nr:hypothetical protein [Deltaproteobacteria bacterium]